jgi:hypothetical protein
MWLHIDSKKCIDVNTRTYPSHLWSCSYCNNKWGSLRAALHYDGEGYQSKILGEFWNMIGQEWDCPVQVYSTVKNSPMENFAHRWKNDMATNMATLFWRGILQKSSFLGNLKALNKKLGLWRTLSWIKYYPSMCCFQHFKVIFKGLGLVFKHFHMFQHIR